MIINQSIFYSDKEGNFSLEGISKFPISIVIKKADYQDYEIILEDNQSLNIILKKDTVKSIAGVTIKANKPLLKRKIDRLEFNIDKTPLQNLNAWDILKNTPNILVKNEELSVRGNSQIIVTINDKKTMMTQEQLKQLLENTDGNNVSSVEVITNPPAKYEAQGSAIINIKMKQNVLSGYKGRISTRYTQATYAKGLIGTSQSYNTDKWQLTGNYNFVTGDYVRKNFDVVIFDKDKTRWESDMVRKTHAHEQHVYNFSGQYNLDSLSTVQFGFDGYNAPNNNGHYNVPTNIYNTENNQLQSYYLTSNKKKQYDNSFNSYLVFDKKFGDHNLTWTNNSSMKRFKENQDVETLLNFDGRPANNNRFANNSIQDISLYATQLDYRFSNDQFTLESGLKYSFVKNKNDLDFFDGTSGNLVPDLSKSNLFNYKENIFAAYISSEYKWRKWEMKAGLRSETTLIKTNSDNPVVENKTTRTGLFPTFYLMYNLKEDQQLGLSYGKRIDRPNYDFLNPSKSYYNLYSYFQGDANLKSTIIHNLSLTYTVKDWNFEAYYSYIKDPSMEISVQNPQTFETVYNYTNIDHGQNLGANFSKSFSIKPFWKLNIFAMGEYQENYFMGTDKVLYKNDVFFYNANVSTQITLDKAKTWDLNVSYVYNSKTVQGSFDISSSQRTNIIINKKMFDKKLEAGMVFNDIFRTDRNTISTRYADQNQYFKDYRDTQYFMINLKYNFGNQKVKDAKAGRKTDEQNRL
ncbi:outer membrane beta-barrel family protein [Epilithonimonas arachidiradicis]|uniref:Outer membrane receptor protein involved in Fe transport n=1 Tax=Epilithonimonas arachidiradicis TaxID=1617282 RepID=A0A420CMH1_9FLAO|nr:outer membrane beta-barrel family protein [Epilithonimonas arachidiradicis]RKE79586.1 outer membrane receptor protein involved in Fe transport [Epilithonimonas arachidiradicis]GGG66333.1 TonB-dependent receptor [Epilithonimonas arachidiradicis]